MFFSILLHLLLLCLKFGIFFSQKLNLITCCLIHRISVSSLTCCPENYPSQLTIFKLFLSRLQKFRSQTHDQTTQKKISNYTRRKEAQKTHNSFDCLTKESRQATAKLLSIHNLNHFLRRPKVNFYISNRIMGRPI